MWYEVEVWHTNFGRTFLSNFKSLPNLIRTSAGINNPEDIFIDSVTYGIKRKRDPKCNFIFSSCLLFFRIHRLNVVFSCNIWWSPSIYDCFPSLVAHELKKSFHASLPIVIIVSINNWWRLTDPLSLTLSILNRIELTQPE